MWPSTLTLGDEVFEWKKQNSLDAILCSDQLFNIGDRII